MLHSGIKNEWIHFYIPLVCYNFVRKNSDDEIYILERKWPQGMRGKRI